MDTRLTPHRQVVLEVLMASKDHPTAREVFERSVKHSPRLSFATVYNALNHLTGTGHLRALRFGDGAVRFDPMTVRHDHVFCRACGALFDAVGLSEPVLPAGAAPAGFLVEEATVRFQGICAACRKSATRGAEK
jgi:Fur family peroxide stress response transcriptional regulator